MSRLRIDGLHSQKVEKESSSGTERSNDSLEHAQIVVLVFKEAIGVVETKDGLEFFAERELAHIAAPPAHIDVGDFGLLASSTQKEWAQVQSGYLETLES